PCFLHNITRSLSQLLYILSEIFPHFDFDLAPQMAHEQTHGPGISPTSIAATKIGCRPLYVINLYSVSPEILADFC
ncbi:hypothetical protein P7H02_21080, partial [Paenibacillus larvae]|uniref:hypothetical protein n=1 Tax=Paenibacillus larvae TaxID=1464 RepID=UPI0028918FD2